MFRSLLIANRGEIAVRIMRTAQRMGLRTIAVYSDADRDALHVASADTAVRLGPAPAAESYLSIEAVIDAARRTGAEAIHPGYGFLSENPAFVEAVEGAGLVFVGPPASAIRAMGLKDAAKRMMEAAGVPVVPGYHGGDQDPARLAAEASRIGWPVLIKASAGGGGKGMRRVDDPAAFPEALAACRREALSAFGDDTVLVERCIDRPRHIEIQVFADAHGNAVHLFERDCSLQRRHQKVIEEAPAPGMTAEMRAAMGEAAVRAARAVGYRGAGTVEFIADASEGLRPDRFFFMEMNTRLQVEHPVTEAVAGVDLVEWQLLVAAGEPLPHRQDELTLTGHAFEARLYAEDPARGFLPQTGRLGRFDLAGTARVDAGVRAGDVVTPHYDPMLAKLIVHGRDRATALGRLADALGDSLVTGCRTNLAFLERLARDPDVAAGDVDTGLIGRKLADLVAEPAPPREAVALAAVAISGLLDPPDGSDPFATLVGFRLWGAAESHVRLAAGERIVDATVETLDPAHHRIRLAAPDGEGQAQETDSGPAAVTVAVRAKDGERVRVDFGGEQATCRVVHDGAAVVVGLERHWHRFDPAAGSGLDDGAYGHAGDGKLRAPMPGLVRLVHVAEGDLVEAGDPLVVTEAMKMELSLAAPRAGRVANLSVAAGDRVEEGAILLVLEEVADG